MKLPAEAIAQSAELGANTARELWQALIGETWNTGPFMKLAQKSGEIFEAGIKKGSEGPVERVLPLAKNSSGDAYAAVHPIIGAAMRKDKNLYPSFSDANSPFFNDYQIGYNVADHVGLHPNAIEGKADGGHFQLRVKQGPDVQVDGDVVRFARSEFGGTTPGYLDGRYAHDQLARRYGFDPASLAEIPFDPAGKSHFSPDQLRNIEKVLGLEKSSLAYEPQGLVYQESLVRAGTPGWNWQSGTLPFNYASDSTATKSLSQTITAESLGHEKVMDKYGLYSQSMFAHSSLWESDIPKGIGTDFKFHIIGSSARDLRKLQDRLLPALSEDPEYKQLLRDWKTVHPLFRNHAGEFTGQIAKSFTLYPASLETSPVLARKLQALLKGMPERDLPADVSGRPLTDGLNLVISRDRYPTSPADWFNVATFDKDLHHSILSDPALKPFLENDRISDQGLRLLEERSGSQPFGLTYADDGYLGIKAGSKKPDSLGKAYLHDGTAYRRGENYLYRTMTDGFERTTSSGYSGRWGLHIVGAKYDYDPLSSAFK